MKSPASPVVVGVDLGGSKILSAVVDETGTVLASDRRPTVAEKGCETVIRNVNDSILSAISKSGLSVRRIRAIGLGAPGISNPETGIVYRSPNLPDWRHVPMRDLVEEVTGLKAFLINDANAAALGEMNYGAAKGIKNFIYITISTGIGGGIIINGELYTGSAGMAGEVGHMVVEPDGLRCNCGGRGCWELYASGSAIARRAREKIAAGRKSLLLELANGNLHKIDASLTGKAAKKGDTLAKELVAETSRYLAMGFGSLINIFNPEMIVVGGGLTKMGNILLRPAFKQTADRCYEDAYKETRFAVAELGENSGVLGAGAYAVRKLQELNAKQK